MLPASRPGAFYAIDSESVNAGIPYADAFAVTIHYCLSRVSSAESRLVVVNNIKYKKSVWGITKSIIEKNCWAGVEEFYSHLGRALAEECAKMSLGASPVPSPKKGGVGGVAAPGQVGVGGATGSLPRRRPQRKVKGKAPDVPVGVVPLLISSGARGGSLGRNGVIAGGVVQGEGGVRSGGISSFGAAAAGQDVQAGSAVSSGAALKVILGVLIGLLLLNGFLFYKLSRLENGGPSFISPQTFTFTG